MRTPAPARAHARKATPRKRGPKPGTRSWRKFNYTPELLADCRRRYEQTPESNTSIARDYGIDECTVRRLAKDHGWVKFPSQRRDLPPDVALRRRVEAMAQSPLIPAQAGIRADEGPLPATIAQGIAEVQARIGEITARRLAGKETAAEAQRAPGGLANLTATLRDLQRMQGGGSQQTGTDSHDAYDDLPADLDEFRLHLARRIDALFAQGADEGADQPPDDGGAAPA